MALLCRRAFYLLECFLRQAVMLFVWFIASASPRRSEPACKCVFSHVHNALALSTEIYCSLGDKEPFVWKWHYIWTAMLPLLVPLCKTETLLSIQQQINNAKAWPSITVCLTFPSAFVSKRRRVLKCCEYSTNPTVIWWCFQHWHGPPLFSHLWYQNRHLTLCIHSASAGGCRAWQMDQPASRQREEMSERKAVLPISQHTVWFPNMP